MWALEKGYSRARQRIARVQEAFSRRDGLQGWRVVTDESQMRIQIGLQVPARGVTAISISGAWDVQHNLFAETALIGADGVMYTEELGYANGIRRFLTEDEFFEELARLRGLLVASA